MDSSFISKEDLQLTREILFRWGGATDYIYAQYQEINEIDDKIKTIETSVSSSLSDGMPRGKGFTGNPTEKKALLVKSIKESYESVIDSAKKKIESRANIKMAIDNISESLPETNRQTLVLRYKQKLPMKEVSEKMNVSESTAWKTDCMTCKIIFARIRSGTYKI